MITGADVVAAARLWLGTPFHHQASLRGVGTDCIGLVAGVARDLGLPEGAAFINDPRFRGYRRRPEVGKLMEACAEYLDPVPEQARPGLGMIAQFTFYKEPMHFAIVSQPHPLYVIHSYQNAGGVVENGGNAKFWRRLRLYKLRGVV